MRAAAEPAGICVYRSLAVAAPKAASRWVSESPADCKPEHRLLFEIRQGLPILCHGVDERGLVREGRAVRHDRRLEKLADDGGIVRPVQPEGRIHHGEHHLKLDAGGGSQLLGARSDSHTAIKA